MNGTASLESVARKIRPFCSLKGKWVGTVIPRRKQTNVEDGEARVEKEKADPILAFSRPPPLPPVLGPLVALSMLESWNKRDNDDD